jgi:hypothetical protein
MQQAATSELTQLLVKDLEALQGRTLKLKKEWVDFNGHFIKVSTVQCLFCDEHTAHGACEQCCWQSIAHGMLAHTVTTGCFCTHPADASCVLALQDGMPYVPFEFQVPPADIQDAVQDVDLGGERPIEEVPSPAPQQVRAARLASPRGQ